MKTDIELKAIAFDKFMAAVGTMDKAEPNRIAMITSSITLSTLYGAEKAIDLAKEKSND